MSLTFSPSFSLRFLLPCSLSFPLWHYAFYISFSRSIYPSSFLPLRLISLSPSSSHPLSVSFFLYPLLASLTLCHRLPLASSLSLSLSLSICRESEKKGQNLAICLSLSVSAAALWASLDIRGSARTGVRGNPAATRGVDRDDDDDKLPAGKALRGTADTERARRRDVGEGGRRESGGRPTERRERKCEKGTGGRGDCVARGSERGGESTNEETNALRSKEHACSGTGECC